MNLFQQLAKLFTGGGTSGGTSGDRGHYYYVRCTRCGEVVQVRIDPMNDLSALDSGEGLFSHKVIVGRRCYNRMEADFTYDANRKLTESQVSGGDFVDKAAFDEDQAKATNTTP